MTDSTSTSDPSHSTAPPPTPISPTSPAILPIKVHRRAVLAYKAHRTTMDIASLKKHIARLDREAAITRSQILELENVAERVPKLVQVEDLLTGENKWVDEIDVSIKKDEQVKSGLGIVGERTFISDDYEIEEAEMLDVGSDCFDDSDSDEESSMSGEGVTGFREDVYVLDGGNTVISVQEMVDGGDEDEFVVNVSKAAGGEERRCRVGLGGEDFVSPVEGDLEGERMSASFEDLDGRDGWERDEGVLMDIEEGEEGGSHG